MRLSSRFATLLAALLLACLPFALGQETSSHAQVARYFGKLPLSFEANQGQANAKVRYLSRGNGYSLFLTDSAAVLALTGNNKAGEGTGSERPSGGKSEISSRTFKTDVVRMELTGGSQHPQVAGTNPLSGTTNYFIGKDPSKWRSGVPTYGKVRYTGVYPGVDLVYYGNQQQLEYDFVVAPGADPGPIKLRLSGARRLRLDGDGNLLIDSGNSHVVFNKPVVYQEEAGQRRKVDGRFRLLAGKSVGFALGSYDRSKALVIDPTLAYSTFLAAPGSNSNNGGIGYAVATDSSSNVYVVGLTGMADFPTTSGVLQPSIVGDQINTAAAYPFVTKLDPTGSKLIYSTYLSGSGNDDYYGDSISSIFVDKSGNAYVAGRAFSPDFPTTSNAFQTANRSSGNSYSNCFVSELNPTGTALVYSTYLGGSQGEGDYCVQVTVNSAGNAYATGTSTSSDFPLTPGALLAVNPNERNKPFVTEFNPGGTALVYSTLLGGSNSDYANGIALDSSGNAYVTGQTDSTDFPVTNGAYQTVNEAYVARYQPTGFVAKLNPLGSALVYATYLGGSGGSSSFGDDPTGIGVDSAGDAYVAGVTTSQDFPVTAGAYQSTNKTYSGGTIRSYTNAFVTKLNPAGTELIFSTYLGSSAGEIMTIPGVYNNYGTGPASRNMVLDSNGNVYLTGGTYGIDFPVTSNAFQSINHTEEVSGANVYPESTNAFLTELTSTGALEYSTYLGGTGSGCCNPSDYGSSLALDPSGNVYVTGLAFSNNFPTTPGAFQTGKSADYAAFISKFSFGAPTVKSLTTLASSANPQNYGSQVTFTALVEATSGTGIPTGTVTFSFDGGTGSPVKLDATGHASYSLASLSDAAHTVTASYSGDSTYSASNDNLTQIVDTTPTKVAVVSGSGQSSPYALVVPNPIVVIVTDQAGTPVPNVYVSFAGTSINYLAFGVGGSYTTDYTGKAYAGMIPESYLATGTTSTTLNGTAKVNGVNTPAFFTLIETPQATAAIPTFTPVAGTYNSSSPLNVTITDTTPGAKIYYTTDGSNPYQNSSEIYYQPIPVNSKQETIKAIAVASGYTNSAVATATYSTVPATPPPSFSPPADTYPASQAVTLTDSASGAVFYYTTDGSTPTQSSTQYTAPIVVSNTETINAIAVAPGDAPSSVASSAYTINSHYPLQFIPVTPCRIVDTRSANGTFGGPELSAAGTRTFDIPQSGCNIPVNAFAYSLNVTVVPAASLGYLTIWPAGLSQPTVSTLNSDGRVKANATITPAGANGGVSVFASDATQFILDIDGYFVRAGTNTSGLEFYPLAPCRIADTRGATGALGGPSLTGGAGRAFPVQSSSCGIPSTAKAYSLNITAIPHGSLGYLTTWPTGQSQPNVSTLNASTGVVTANAAIVPAGTGGDISVFVSDSADALLDVNGYFAPPATGGLSLYTVNPCRALDTRGGAGAFNGTLTVPIHGSTCAPPTAAQAYVLNATVIPATSLGYLTLWAAGSTQPNVSTLNASDGAVTSNLAIVPTTNGSVDAFATDSTQLILDISSYFAP